MRDIIEPDFQGNPRFCGMSKWVGTAVIAILMLVALLILFAPRLGWRVDTVLSGSMVPALKVGGAVVIEPVDPDKVQIGDIITYGSPKDGSLITHRVVQIERHSPLYFRTKGDANEDADPFLVPHQNVVGKVRLHIPLLGHVAHFVKTPLGLILLLGIPGFVIIAQEMKNVWVTLSEMERKEDLAGEGSNAK
jgi:signal peptidase